MFFGSPMSDEPATTAPTPAPARPTRGEPVNLSEVAPNQRRARRRHRLRKLAVRAGYSLLSRGLAGPGTASFTGARSCCAELPACTGSRYRKGAKPKPATKLTVRWVSPPMRPRTPMRRGLIGYWRSPTTLRGPNRMDCRAAPDPARRCRRCRHVCGMGAFGRRRRHLQHGERPGPLPEDLSRGTAPRNTRPEE
jgi:hypothetical protein